MSFRRLHKWALVKCRICGWQAAFPYDSLERLFPGREIMLGNSKAAKRFRCRQCGELQADIWDVGARSYHG